MSLFNDSFLFWNLWLQFVCVVVHVIPLHGDYSFVLCFMENDAMSFTRDDTSIIVINPTSDIVHVSTPRLNSSVILLPGEADILFCPAELCHVLGYGIQDKGIYIQSNGSIAVEGINIIKSSTDSFLVRPTHLLSTEYLVVTSCNATLACQVAVVATGNNTSVAIYFPCNVDLIMENGNLYTYGPDRNLLVDLQAHEVYQIQSSSDLTAVVVKSNNTVACFAGANQTMLANDGKEDHIVSALPPTQAWGYEYILAGTESPNFQDIVKIVATEDNTIVDVDSCTHKTFNLAKAFDYVEDPLTCGGYAIHSNFKIVVAHIRIKDNPGMFFPFPTSIFASHYTVYVPNTNVGAHVSSVILYAKTNDIGLIIFNGTLLSTSGWSPILNSEWSYKSVAVDAGLLNIHNNFKKSFGGHLLVVNAFKLSVMNLIPAPYNENAPICCENLEYKIESLTTTEGSGSKPPEITTMETTASDILTTLFESGTTSTLPLNDIITHNTEVCCNCLNNLTRTYRIWTNQELRDMTKINKKNTSIAIRKLTSAQDDRISALGIGCCGVVVLCTVFASIVAIDLSRYVCKGSKVSPKK